MKAGASIKVEFPRRQAMLSIREPASQWVRECGYAYKEVARVPVFVWPMPTNNGLFVVEHQDGTVQRVQPDLLTFIGSKELFDQYDWTEKSDDSCDVKDVLNELCTKAFHSRDIQSHIRYEDVISEYATKLRLR